MENQKTPRQSLGVGIVGLSADGGWASRAHLPALEAVEGLELRALAGSSRESAERAGAEYGVPMVFTDAGELAAHEDVDIVVIAVRVPDHRDLIMPALQAGKTVFSEWPLAKNLGEAVDLADQADRFGVRTAVGLQARAAPIVRYLRDLINDGYIGRVLSTSMVASGGGWGSTVNSRSAYTAERTNGATLLTVPFGHTVDALTMCLSGFTTVAATTATRQQEVRNVETDEILPQTAEDQVSVTGELQSGAVASIHYRGGNSRGTNLLWEINGTEGDLIVSGGSGHLQFGNLSLYGATGHQTELSEIAVPDRYHLVGGLNDSVSNVAHNYIQLREDIANDTATVPDFSHGAWHHHLLDRITRSASSGTRQ